MYCSKCGQEISEFDVYCPHCKGKIKQESTDRDLLNFNIFKEDQKFDDLLNEGVEAEDPINDNQIDKEYEQCKENYINENKETSQSYKYDNAFDVDFDDNEGKGLLGNKVLVILTVVAFVTAMGLGFKFLFLNDEATPEPEPVKEVSKPAEEAGESEIETNDLKTQESNREKIFNNLASVNSNILEVKNNPSLKYDSNADYKVSDIKNSVPLDEKLYKEVGSQKIYHETAIIKALVQFNSKWIDYVNHNDKAVTSLVQRNSRAYKNVVNFRKKNKLQEFLIFEIGEIRKGEKGYYVWTHEKIKEVQNGKSKIKEYHWTYHLVEEEYDFFIFDYIDKEKL